MPYADELFDSAVVLYRVSPESQATLRRAVSTAYYALFHFLIEAACRNWSRPEQRPALARMFQHACMADASNSRVGKHKNAVVGSTESRLYSVATAFFQLYQKRHKADYDLSSTFSARDVELALGLVNDAFADWSAIENEQIAQDYLFSLLFKERKQ
jgi:uncharacterized protein (UPF0332 family)